jgi:hypothetical protein
VALEGPGTLAIPLSADAGGIEGEKASKLTVGPKHFSVRGDFVPVDTAGREA